MLLTLAASALFAAQAMTSVPGPDPAVDEHKDVAFEELSNGQTDAAIAAIQTRLAAEPNDPALLINLGYAYAQQGKLQRAAVAYRAALESETHYRLETAQGGWLDSRKAAEIALHALENSTRFASLGE